MTPLPLTGVKVLEFGHVASGPFAGMLLADLGADVVKVESPDGDQMRDWPPLAGSELGGRFSHNFAALNRNKRSVVSDFRNQEELASVRALCASADVIVENFRPGVLDRFGLGFDEISHGHKGVVYCSISGYGHSSPYSERGAYDVVIQAMSGLMSVTGPIGGEAVKCGVPVADFIAGLYAAFTIVSMRPGVIETGESVHIDCPMLDCLIATSALQTSEFWGTGIEPRALGTAHPRNAPYQMFHGSDKPFVLAAGTDRLWRRVCSVVGQECLADDPRFLLQDSRVKNQVELASILQSRFSQQSASHWVNELDRRGVPCGPLNTFGEMLADPHVKETGLVRDFHMPIGGSVPAVVFPARVSGMRSRLDREAPLLGENTEEVLKEWVVS